MSALNNVEAVSQDKPIWITEAGWPVSGPAENQAVASIDNSKTYWDELGCELFNKYNVWWYILRDNNGSPAPDPSFGIVGIDLGEPLFDLTCPAGSPGASETASEPASAQSASAQSASAESAPAKSAPVESAPTAAGDVATASNAVADVADDEEEEDDCY
jgi:glucan endo-1,3-beta-D-glucosidase